MNRKIIQKTKLIFVILSPVLAYVVASLLIKYNDSPICIWKNVFNVECWGCGLTRAFQAFCNLNFEKAWEYNNKIFIVLPVLFCVWAAEINRICKINKTN